MAGLIAITVQMEMKTTPSCAWSWAHREMHPRESSFTGQVKKSLKSIRTNKSAGPDGIRGKILKACHKELAGVFQRLFQWSLDSYTIPSLWKSSTVIPIPKITKPAVLNDYRPVAFTPIVMKCFDRVIKGILLNETRNAADPFQFAYRAHRGEDDVALYRTLSLYTGTES